MLKLHKKLIKKLFINPIEKVDNNYFFNNFNLFKQLKSHLWSYLTMLAGWFLLIFTVNVYDYISATIIMAFVLGIIIYIPIAIIFLFETIVFRNYKLKQKYVYESPIFSFIWLIGQFVTFSFIAYLVYNLLLQLSVNY